MFTVMPSPPRLPRRVPPLAFCQHEGFCFASVPSLIKSDACCHLSWLVPVASGEHLGRAAPPPSKGTQMVAAQCCIFPRGHLLPSPLPGAMPSCGAESLLAFLVHRPVPGASGDRGDGTALLWSWCYPGKSERHQGKEWECQQGLGWGWFLGVAGTHVSVFTSREEIPRHIQAGVA